MTETDEQWWRLDAPLCFFLFATATQQTLTEHRFWESSCGCVNYVLTPLSTSHSFGMKNTKLNGIRSSSKPPANNFGLVMMQTRRKDGIGSLLLAGAYCNDDPSRGFWGSHTLLV
jgi:hypothetical protein